MDVANTISEQTANSEANTVCHVPNSDPQRLLASCVEHSRDDHKGWVGGRLDCSTDASQDH